MKQKPEKIPDSLIMAIIIHLYLGWGFLYLVKSAVGHLMNNAYLGLIPAMIVILPFLWFAYDLAKMHPDKSITVISSRVLGRFAGVVWAVILILFLFFFETSALRFSKLMVYTYFFDSTPFFLITAAFITCALYTALKGVRTIGRLAAFMLLPPLLVILILELFGMTNINLLNIRPFFTGTLRQWFNAGIDLTFVMLPATAIFYYMPFLQKSQSIKKISLTSLGIVVLLFFLAIMGTVGAFGPTLTLKMNWSIVEFFHIIDNPFLLLEQAGLFFLIAWFPFHFIAVSQGLFIIGNELNIIIPLIKRNWFIVAISMLVFAGANLPFNIISLEDFFNRFQHLITFSFLGLLFVIWLIARLQYLINKKRRT